MDNKLNGYYEHKTPLGDKILSKGHYINGRKFGLWTSYWYPKNLDEKLIANIITYNNGVKHGKNNDYHANGNLRYTGHYNNNEQTGLWEFFNVDGTISFIEYIIT